MDEESGSSCSDDLDDSVTPATAQTPSLLSFGLGATAVGPRLWSRRVVVSPEKTGREDIGITLPFERSVRDSLLRRFEDVAVEIIKTSPSSSSHSSPSGPGHSQPSSPNGRRESAELKIPCEKFVAWHVERGVPPSWAYAAFRTFDSLKCGYLSKDQYLMACYALQTNIDDVSASGLWLDLRRRVVFTYFTPPSSKGGLMDREAFCNFLSELSKEDVIPEHFGVRNPLWIPLVADTGRPASPNGISGTSSVAPASNVTRLGVTRVNSSRKMLEREQLAAEREREAARGDIQCVVQSLAEVSERFAQERAAHEQLRQKYAALEDDICTLKLQLASFRASHDRDEDEGDDNH